MIYRGHVKNGAVVFDEPVSLSDGTQVCVEPLNGTSQASGPVANDFWREPSIEELAARQGVEMSQRLDEKLGQGTSLWDDDQDFEAFLSDIDQRRREGRRP